MDKKLLLTRLFKRFKYLVDKYMQAHNLNQKQLAEVVGMQRTHLNALLSGKADRPLSAYYLYKFIRKGIISVKDIYDGTTESEREEEFWEQASEAENIDLLKRIARLRKKAVDVDQQLELLEKIVSK